MQFSELIGQEIAVLIPKIHQSDLQRVIVVGVAFGQADEQADLPKLGTHKLTGKK